MKLTESKIREMVNEILDDLECEKPSAQAQVGYCDAETEKEIGDPVEDACEGGCCGGEEEPEGVEIISIDTDEDPEDLMDRRHELMSMFHHGMHHGDFMDKKADLFDRLSRQAVDDTNEWMGVDDHELNEGRKKGPKNIYKSMKIGNLYKKPKTIRPKK